MKKALVLVSLLVTVFALSRHDFPAGFQFGAATASYQSEGQWNVDGRGLSIWDVFTHEGGHVYNNETGDVSDCHYNLTIVEADLQRMASLGFDYYRFSIAWPRIFPDGEGNINQLGIDHYNAVINLTLQYGMTPFVTLYHWDLPLAIHTKYNGFLTEGIITPFATYAETCFQAFGDRVKMWLTFNEPTSICWLGYGVGVFAPGRCSGCAAGGNTSTEPYICAHHLLLAHAQAVSIYRTGYAAIQGGKIGIVLNADWAEPNSTAQADLDASERYMEFQLGWYGDPVYFGDYPAVMKQNVGSRLPNFTDAQKQSLKGSSDFFALNHYTSEWVADATTPQSGEGYAIDTLIQQSRVRNGTQIGPVADSSWLYVVPFGMSKILKWVSNRYNDSIYITENGVDAPGEGYLPLADCLNDTFRINYFSNYLAEVLSAIEAGADVRSYTAWSLLDNFEWADGYSKRFGIVYVDYNSTTLARHNKASANWFQQVLNKTTNAPSTTYTGPTLYVSITAYVPYGLSNVVVPSLLLIILCLFK